MLLSEYLQERLIPLRPEEAIATTETNDSTKEVHYLEPIIADASEATLRRGRSALLYIRQLRRLNYQCLRPVPLLKLEFEKLQNRLCNEDPSLERLTLSTVYKLSLKFDKADGDPKSVYPDFASRGAPQQPKISKIALETLESEFKNIHENTKSKINFAEIEKNVETQLLSFLPPVEVFQNMPSRSTIERLTKTEFGAYVITSRNKGSRYANKIFRDHYPRDRAVRPLETVEFDDKDTRTFIVDETTGLVCGRAFVTVGVDQFSTVPLGFSISDKYRSLISAMEAFRNSVVPGIQLDEDADSMQISEFYGTPGIAIFDNALYFHAKSLEAAIDETVKSIVAFAKPYTPTEKSCVEDFNGRMVTHFQELPGFGGPKASKDGLTEGLSTAVLTTKMFKTSLLNWSSNGYCNTPRSDGWTPRQRWQNASRYTKRRLPANLGHFDIAFTLRHSVQLRPDGVVFIGLPYQSDELISLRKRIGATARVDIRYHPYHLERIFVFDPTNRKYLTVPSAIPGYVNRLTLSQHQQIRKLARENGKKNPALPELFAFREEFRIYIKQLLTSSKRIERKWASQIGPVNETNAHKVAKKDISTEIVSELEDKCDELARVELEPCDEHWDLPEDF
jgi:putative transposase